MSRLKMNPVLCIAGPTASGKSALAIRIAKRVDGEIINADAMQVYRDLLIISARPSRNEEAQVPHHLFGHIDAAQRYSVGQWLEDVQPVILDVLARGKVPIVIGGTGLYFKALVQGLAKIPEPDTQVRQNVQSLYENQGIGALRLEAEHLDPIAAARVLGDDPQRLIRIVEVAQSSGTPLSVWQADTKPVIPKHYWQGIVLTPERAGLYARINQRFDTMAQTGGLDEVRALMQRNLDPMLPCMKAIGVPQLIPALTGDMPMDEALEAAKRETRRFAKRQYTWFRGQTPDWPKILSPDEVNMWDKIPKLNV